MLTDDELGFVKRFHQANVDLRTCHEYVVAATVANGDVEAIAPLANVLRQIHGAWIEHFRAYNSFLNVGIENTDPPPRPDLLPSQFRDRALFYFDRYRGDLMSVASALVPARERQTDNSSYQDALRRAQDQHLHNALVKMGVLDRSRELPFAEPWPELRDGTSAATGKAFTIPTVVGPHGEYCFAQWGTGRAKNYALVAVEGMIELYARGADPMRMRSAWTPCRQLLSTLDRTTALLADVTFTPQETKWDRFCRALGAFKLQTVDAAEFYERWQGAAAQLITSELTREQAQSLAVVVAKLGDSWKHLSKAGAWKGLTFPESLRCDGAFAS